MIKDLLKNTEVIVRARSGKAVVLRPAEEESREPIHRITFRDGKGKFAGQVLAVQESGVLRLFAELISPSGEELELVLPRERGENFLDGRDGSFVSSRGYFFLARAAVPAEVRFGAEQVEVHTRTQVQLVLGEGESVPALLQTISRERRAGQDSVAAAAKRALG